MNIVQAYTNKKNQFIILISGFSGSGKTKLSKFIADLFSFQHVNLTHYYYPTEIFDKEENYVSLKNGTRILNWDNIYESVDWNKFNTFVNNNKKIGVVAVGFGFPTELLQFDPDFHIHIKINKSNLIENREKYITAHLSKIDPVLTSFATREPILDNDKNSDIDIDKNILNNITYPIYYKLIEESKIDKYINTNDVSDDKIKEEIFEYLMNMVEKWLNRNNKTNKTNKTSVETIDTCKTVNIGNTGNTQKYRNYEGNIPKLYNDGNIPKLHNDGNSYQYDEFYYPNSKRKLYDFNDEGIDYPEDYIKQYNTKTRLASGKKSDEFDSDSSSNSSDAEYLFTTNGKEFEEPDQR